MQSLSCETFAAGVIKLLKNAKVVKQITRMVAQARHVLRDKDLMRKYLMQ